MLMLMLINHVLTVHVYQIGMKKLISIQSKWVDCCNISFTKDDRSSETWIENCQTCHIEGGTIYKNWCINVDKCLCL